MFTPIHLDKNFTLIPNDLYLVVDGNELMLLIALMQFQGTNSHGKPSCYASLTTLNKYLRTNSKNKTIKIIKQLKDKGYIDYIKGNSHGKANEYSVNMDKILYDIKQKLSLDEIGKRALREYSEKQKDAMSARRVGNNPELLSRIVKAQGKELVNVTTGEILE